jgi:putative phosphoribosyl transferase
MVFVDREDAGRRLAAKLGHLRDESVVVLGIPRGGVPVAFEVAQELDAPLDVIVVRKLGVPYQPELGMGAIGENGVRIINTEVVQLAGVSEAELTAVENRERVELDRRARRYRRGRPRVSLKGRTAVIVDDGIATGSTARAACRVARAQGAARVVLAVPVAPPEWNTRMSDAADELIAVETPERFCGVGQFYINFNQTSDDTVVVCLERSAERAPATAMAVTADDDPPVFDGDVEVHAGPVRLRGHLTVPEHAIGIVVFAHGSGSSRHSPRNRYVATVLNRAGLGTLLFDLLTTHEEHDRTKVFDIGLLARRLVDATRWLRNQPDAMGLPIGYFGASTGAAAALWAAAERDNDVATVVSRGGRPDLAADRLPAVAAPTLFIVGGHDNVVLDLNRSASNLLRCEHRLTVIRGATHLFDEPGTLQAAAEAARDWFVTHLSTIACASA